MRHLCRRSWSCGGREALAVPDKGSLSHKGHFDGGGGRRLLGGGRLPVDGWSRGGGWTHRNKLHHLSCRLPLLGLGGRELSMIFLFREIILSSRGFCERHFNLLPCLLGLEAVAEDWTSPHWGVVEVGSWRAGEALEARGEMFGIPPPLQSIDDVNEEFPLHL